MTLYVFIKTTSNDFAIDITTHIGDFFRSLIDQKNNQLQFREICGNPLTYMLKHDSLTTTRRSHNQGPLAFTKRCQKIHHTRGQWFRASFYCKPLLRINRRQFIKRNDLRVIFRCNPIDIDDFFNAGTLRFTSVLHKPTNHNSFTQPVLLDHCPRHKRITTFTRIIGLGTTQETIPVRMQF